MDDSTTFPTSDQLAGRTPPARLGAIPGRLAPAAHRRSPWRDERGRQSVAQPGQGRWFPSPQRLQLLELLAQGPQAFGFRGDVWTQPRVARVIRRHFGVQYHSSQVGRILKQYG